MDVLFPDVGYTDPDFTDEATTAEEEIRLEEYRGKVRELIQDSRAYELDWLSKRREDSIDYYEGKTPGDAEAGRTQIVSRDARDTVMAIMPSLVRIFTSSEHVVEFVPGHEAIAEAAKDATDYVRHVVWEDNDGFMNMYEVLHDCLVKNMGIWKWWVDRDERVEYKEFSNLTQEQFEMLTMEEPDLDIVELEVAEDSDDPEAPVVAFLRVRYVTSTPMLRIQAVPPEQFRIDRSARKMLSSARLVGHERIVPASDLLERGHSWDELEEYMGAQHSFSEEEYIRNPGTNEGIYYDGSEVLFGEYYIRVDRDGDGIAELRRICVVGEEMHIIEDEPADHIRFAGVCPDPVPHTAVGNSVVDQVKDIQSVRTNLIRSALDSLADTLNPRTVFNPMMTETDDVMNTEIGANIRTKGDPATAVVELTKAFVGGPAFEAFTLMDAMRASRTGISEASKGVDPKALQSTTVMGVDAIVSGAQERIELVARIIAETGLKDLHKGILRDIVNNPNPERSIQVRGRWKSFDVSRWDPTMGVRVNPSMGKGTDQIKLQVLGDVAARQESIIAKFGISNPVVTPREYRNTLVDMLELVNFRNPSRYFREITDEMLEAMMNQPKDPDPALLLATAEIEKVRAETAKAVSERNFDNDKLAMDDDFRRDKLNVDAALTLEELAARGREQELRRLNEANTRPSYGASPQRGAASS